MDISLLRTGKNNILCGQKRSESVYLGVSLPRVSNAHSRLTIDVQNMTSSKYNRPKSLHSYQGTLKDQIRDIESRKLKDKQIRKMRTQQTILNQHTKSQVLISQLESFKYRLKALNLQRQSGILKKERLIKLKSQQNTLNCTIVPLQPTFMPLINHNCNQRPSISLAFRQGKSLQQKNTQSIQSICPSKSRGSSTINYQKQYRNSRYKLIDTDQSMLIYPQIKNKQGKIVQKKQLNKNNFQKRMNDFKRFNNKQSNIKRLRKCFIAVYFYKCLEKNYLKMVGYRKKFFLSFWPTQFLKFEESYREYFFDKFLPLFSVLKQKQNSSLSPDENDTQGLKKQKNRTIRQLVRIFFECLKSLKSVQNMGKIAWSFCKNGSFVEKGVLNVNQVDFLCFSEKYGYLRMNLNLQKSQIISFILIKFIIYKFLLHPWIKWPEQFNPLQNKNLIPNLKLVGSIIYCVFIWLRNEYLEKADQQLYPLGNYKQLKYTNSGLFKIQCSPPLLYQTKKVQPELISGLYSEQFLKAHISFKKIVPNLQIARQVVQKIHYESQHYNSQYRSKVNQYIKKIDYSY